ncbi:MAG: hypothetical protein RIE73_31025 [Coleofasciculus sp. C1-SOL-03]|uniref:hypothetical protein n=1 Tax=Coleofasciculus sp. C1-SOL-03 TaxID=3069522 RepID=UPI003300DF28
MINRLKDNCRGGFRDNCRGGFRESIQILTNNETTKPALLTNNGTTKPALLTNNGTTKPAHSPTARQSINPKLDNQTHLILNRDRTKKMSNLGL